MLSIETSMHPVPTERSHGFKMKRLNYRTWGPKVRRIVDTYHTAEWAQQILLEADPRVKTYCELFPRIDGLVKGKRLRNTFTFWVRYWDGIEEVIQVVRKHNLVPNKTGEMEPKRWTDILDWSERQGLQCHFVVESTKELKNKILIDNWSQVIRFVQSGLENFNQELSNRVQGAVYAREVLRISDLPKVFSMEIPEELFQLLFVLLHEGKVKINLSQQVIDHTLEVEPADEIAKNY